MMIATILIHMILTIMVMIQMITTHVRTRRSLAMGIITRVSVPLKTSGMQHSPDTVDEIIYVMARHSVGDFVVVMDMIAFKITLHPGKEK